MTVYLSREVPIEISVSNNIVLLPSRKLASVCLEQARIIVDNFAVQFYRTAADKGQAEAQYNLGLIYCTGRGVEQNYTKAADLFLNAADQGHFKAQYFLGRMLEKGIGVRASHTTAIYWYQKSADQGNTKAELALLRLERSFLRLERSLLRLELNSLSTRKSCFDSCINLVGKLFVGIS